MLLLQPNLTKEVYKVTTFLFYSSIFSLQFCYNSFLQISLTDKSIVTAQPNLILT